MPPGTMEAREMVMITTMEIVIREMKTDSATMTETATVEIITEMIVVMTTAVEMAATDEAGTETETDMTTEITGIETTSTDMVIRIKPEIM